MAPACLQATSVRMGRVLGQPRAALGFLRCAPTQRLLAPRALGTQPTGEGLESCPSWRRRIRGLSGRVGWLKQAWRSCAGCPAVALARRPPLASSIAAPGSRRASAPFQEEGSRSAYATALVVAGLRPRSFDVEGKRTHGL